MNIKLTYIRRLWIIAFIIGVPSLHANIFDLFNLQGIERLNGDMQYALSVRFLGKCPRAYLPLTLDIGKKSSEEPVAQRTSGDASNGLKLRLNDWDGRSLVMPMMFDIITVYSTIRGYFHGESIAKVEQTIKDHINGRNFFIAQMLLIKLLYATKKKGIPTSFALISKHNPQVSEGELWHIFKTFSAVMQRSLALNYNLVARD